MNKEILDLVNEIIQYDGKKQALKLMGINITSNDWTISMLSELLSDNFKIISKRIYPEKI